MARYEKYLEIIKNVDDALEKHKKLLEGKVTRENLALVEKLLCIQEKAWKACWIVDRIDDISEGTRKLSEKGNGPDQSTMQSLSQGGKGGAQGKDFRGGREDTWSEAGPYGSHTTGFRTPGGGTYGMTEGDEYDTYSMFDHYPEENRRGVPGSGRGRYRRSYRGRSRSEMDHGDWEDDEREENRRGRSRRTGRYVHRAEMDNGNGMETDFFMLPGMVPSFYGRMGYMNDAGESNRMYGNGGMGPMNGIQVPLQNTGTVKTLNGLQIPVQNNGMQGNGSDGGNNGTSAAPQTTTPQTTA